MGKGGHYLGRETPNGESAPLRDAGRSLRRTQRPRVSRLLAASAFVCLAVAAGGGGGAAAASGPSSTLSVANSAASTNDFCTLATADSKSSFNPTKLLTPSVLKAEYSKLKSEEPKVLSLSPSSLKPDFQKIFAFDNTYFGELAKVNYVTTKVPLSFYRSLIKKAAAVKPASVAITTYLHQKCGIKLP